MTSRLFFSMKTHVLVNELGLVELFSTDWGPTALRLVPLSLKLEVMTPTP